MDERRAKRVSEALREELSELIGYEMTDPRVGGVDVTEVHIAPDMRVASVRVSLPAAEDERRGALEALEHAKGFLRREVGRRLQLFRVPDFRFEADAELAGSHDRVQQLLKRIRKGRPKDE
ncbi:MAG TPA: 30S ribosome-binding factor RbfA [Solibacterales bacterium]|nr:30S ribosome-binding factor RbfA [Bryobacterales bacterium]